MACARMMRFGSVFFVAFLTVAFFLGNQRLAYADPGDIPTDPIPNACSDGLDNDGDGLVDFVPLFGDPGCEDIFDQTEDGNGGGGGGVDPVPTTQCNDGVDNDNDGLIDFLPTLGDPDCDNFSDDSESTGGGGGSNPACSDGLDNDGDGKVDSADPGCADSSDTDETDPAGGGGPGDGGGGGGAAPVCEDNIDNDGDGLKDMADPGCENAGDNDETNGSGGGGGSGGVGVGDGSTAATSTGEILGVATSTEALACDTYLTAFLRFGASNDSEQVMRLQKVLKDFEQAEVEENGLFDQATLKAVHAFQTKYDDEILAPWGIKSSTGYVYLTTRKKVNEVRCENKKAFPLTDEETKKIEESRVSAVVTQVNETPRPESQKPAAPTKQEQKKQEEEVKDTTLQKTATSSKEDTAVRESGLKRVWDFLGRLFNRAR